MDTLIVYLDDAVYALQQLAPLYSNGLTDQTPKTQWVLVACAPRMSRRIGKWLSHSARENWREKWSAKLFAQVCPQLQTPDNQVHKLIAKGPLFELTQQLKADFSNARVIDARRPKFGVVMEPVVQGQSTDRQAWQLPAAVGGLGAVLILASE